MTQTEHSPLTRILDDEWVRLSVKHILIQAHNIWLRKSQVQVLQSLSEVEAGNVINQLSTTGSIDVGNLSIRHRLRALGVQGLEDLPVVLLPALITGHTVAVEDTFQGLGVGVVRGILDEVAILRGLSAVGCVVVA